MIVSFSVSNFRSFLKEETLSLVASKRIADESAGHLVPIPNSSEKALKITAIYGANGAGKSNICRAVRYLRGLALGDRKKGTGTGRRRFAFVDDSHMPSTFDIQFIKHDKLYRYIIAVDDEKVVEESLSFYKKGKEKEIYSRVTDDDLSVHVQVDSVKKNSKIASMANVGGPENQSFLACVFLNIDPDKADDDFVEVINWFATNLVVIFPTSSYLNLLGKLSNDNNFLNFASEILADSSTGVDGLEVARQELLSDDLYNLIPKSSIDKFINDADNDMPLTFPMRGNCESLVVEKDGAAYKQTLMSKHKGAPDCYIDFYDESDGTKRLLNIIPAIFSKDEGKVYVIDEIDRSMHPLLARMFIEKFISICKNDKRQLIITTHETHLLDKNLLRRDEIWFAEKDRAGASHLTSLVDFKIRNDLDISKNYLQGRFGAIPFLGGSDHLMQYEECTKDVSG